MRPGAEGRFLLSTTITAVMVAIGASAAVASPTVPATPTVHVDSLVLSTRPGSARQELAILNGLRETTPTTPGTYRVQPGDTLAKVSGRFCGTPDDYPSLASASGISNPDDIFPGELVKLACHAAYSAAVKAFLDPPPAQTQAIEAVATTPMSQALAPDPQPAPPATVTGLSGPLSFSGLEALWVAAGGPAAVEWDAATIAECESGGNQYAANPSGADGYWQILGQVVPGNVFDSMVNAENAVTKYDDAGHSFAPWVCQA